ncbi:DUF4352 domain-containing protein [Nocardiopsis sp. NPDC058631]|uniref:DUF4352 domain-containing protein n=1 Tax=Nocardiopsis sp. NPDC058631 TaxID=3346566 RepID=UPI0036583F5F
MYEQPPGGPSNPQQPPPGQPPPPQRRKAWPWVLLGCGAAALLIIVLAVACTMAVFSGGPAGEEPAGGEEEAEETVGMGEPGTVGQWQVTVEGIETAATYGDEFSEEEAQGEFAIVDLTVENTGNEATTFDDSAIRLIDDEGNTHSSEGSVGDDALFLEQINPGNEVSGSAAVDVPEGTEITAVEVTDVWSSEGPLLVQVD